MKAKSCNEEELAGNQEDDQSFLADQVEFGIDPNDAAHWRNSFRFLF
jgi:hypothetical protein